MKPSLFETGPALRTGNAAKLVSDAAVRQARRASSG